MSTTLLIILLVFIGITAWGLYVFQIKPRQETGLKDLYAEGLDLLVTGRLKNAYENFKTLVQKDTNNIKAYMKLGQAAREGGNPIHALKIHTSLIHRKNITPFENIELYKNLALDYHMSGNLGDAIEKALYILKLEKNNEWALSHLIQFYREDHNWEKAGEYVVRLFKITGETDDHRIALYKIQEGRSLLKQNNYSKARAMFDAAIRIDKNLALAYYFHGNSFAYESDVVYQNAEKIKKTSSPKEKKRHKEAMEKAESLLTKAVSKWTEYARRDSKHAWLVLPKLKDALFALGRYSEVESILNQILANDPDNIECLAALADFYLNRGDSQEALELIESAMDKDELSLVTHLIRLKLKMDKAELRKVSTELDKIIQIASSDKYYCYKTDEKSDINWIYSTDLSKTEMD